MKMDVTGKTGVPVFTNTPTCKIELTAMKIVATGIDTAKDHGNKGRSLHRQEEEVADSEAQLIQRKTGHPKKLNVKALLIQGGLPFTLDKHYLQNKQYQY